MERLCVVVLDGSDNIENIYGPYQTEERAEKVKDQVREAMAREAVANGTTISYSVLTRPLQKWLE